MTERRAHPERDDYDGDVEAMQIGTIYAKAFLAAADAAGNADELLASLDSFVDDVLDRLPKLEAILASQMLSHDERAAILDRALVGADPLLLNFLKVVSEHGRFDLIRAVRRGAHDVYNAMRGRVRVHVSTATPLAGDQSTTIAGRLRTSLGAEPELVVHVRPEMIGGLIVRVGDTVYDGSIAAQLAQVKSQMISRSVHEIQSRRDRFSSPEGD